MKWEFRGRGLGDFDACLLIWLGGQGGIKCPGGNEMYRVQVFIF
jgi:hypothetical protein